jgi:class 3 adenylate cyclase
MTSTINSTLAEIIHALGSTGGDVLHFAGDAILAFWPCLGLSDDAGVKKAIQCCVRIQQTASQAGLIRIKLGRRDEELHFLLALALQCDHVAGRFSTNVTISPLANDKRLRSVRSHFVI